MCYHITHCVGPARRWSVTQVLTAIKKTGLFVGAVVVSAAADLTSSVGTDLSSQTFFIGSASQETAFFRTDFSQSTVLIGITWMTTPTRVADHTEETFPVCTANGGYSNASPPVVVGIASEAFRTCAHTLSVVHSA